MRLRILVTSASVALFMLAPPAGAGGGGKGHICDGVTRGTQLAVRDSCFQGTAHLADPGATVRVTNEGSMTHDITAVDASFASGPLAPGASFEITIDDRRVIPFYCTLHGTPDGSGMAGILVVGTDLGSTASASLVSSETPAAATAAHASDDSGAIVFLAVAALVIAILALAASLHLRLRRHEARA